MNVEFGEECHCLYVIRESQQELDRSSRLQNGFHWVTERRYVENRRRAITTPRKDARTIVVNLFVILGHARQEGLVVSRVDALAPATASALIPPIVPMTLTCWFSREPSI